MMRRTLTTLAFAALLPLAAACAGEEKSMSNDNGPGEAGTPGGTPGAPASGAPETQVTGATTGATGAAGTTSAVRTPGTPGTELGTAHHPSTDSSHTAKRP